MSNYLEKLKTRLHEVSEMAADTANLFIVSGEMQRKRIEICKECDSLFTPTMQCEECLCFIRLKTMAKKSKCPLGKW